MPFARPSATERGMTLPMRRPSPVSRAREAYLAASLAQRSFTLVLLALFGALALVLAANALRIG